MLTQLIKKEIERKTSIELKQNPFFVAAEEGRLTLEQMKDYLHNLSYLLEQSDVCIPLAWRRAEQLGSHQLAEFLREKTEEEKGHSAWAADDLASLGESRRGDDRSINPHMKKLIANNLEMIMRDPKLYLFYMLFAEYFTVLAAPTFLNNVENKCGIAREHLSALTSHGELDKEHVHEDLEFIDRHIGSPDDFAPYFAVIDSSFEVFGSFLADLVVEPKRVTATL